MKRVRLPRRADVVWFVMAFLALHIGFVLFVDCGPIEVYDAEGGKRLRLLKRLHTVHPERPLIAFVGSSRCIVGLRVVRMKSLKNAAGRQVQPFNFAHQGAGPYMNLMNVHRLLRHDLPPSYLVLEIVPGFLVQDRPPTSIMAGADLPVMLQHADRLKVFGDFLRNRLNPFPRHSQSICHQFAPQLGAGPNLVDAIRLTVVGDDRGWMTSRLNAWHGPRTKEQVMAESERFFRPLLQQFRVAAGADSATREMLQLCRQRSIPVVLLLMPEDSTFRSWYTQQGEMKLQQYLDELKQIYEIRIVDARTWIADDEFYDPHHLNWYGAERLSQRLASEVIRPWLLRSAN